MCLNKTVLPSGVNVVKFGKYGGVDSSCGVVPPQINEADLLRRLRKDKTKFSSGLIPYLRKSRVQMVRSSHFSFHPSDACSI
jgi:hypothetical protein